jgi:hypothetical protein
MRPSTFRSNQVVYANASSNRLITTNDLIRLIHQGSCISASPSTTSWPSPRTCSSAARTVPFGSFREMRARRRTDISFARTSTSSPGSMPRARASSAESSSTGSGRWNWSSATRSTAGPEKSGRYVTSREPVVRAGRSPFGGSIGSPLGRRVGSGACSPISPKESPS